MGPSPNAAPRLDLSAFGQSRGPLKIFLFELCDQNFFVLSSIDLHI